MGQKVNEFTVVEARFELNFLFLKKLLDYAKIMNNEHILHFSVW